MRSNTALTDVVLMLVAISWGSTYWVAKGLVVDGGVLPMLSIRMIATAAILFAIVRARRYRVDARSLSLGILYGLILSAVFTFETFGLALTTATNAGLVISSTIIFTPILEAIVKRSPIASRYLVSGIVVMIGIGLLTTDGELTAPTLGDCLILIAAVLRAVHVTIINRNSNARVENGAVLTFVQMATCAVVFTVAAFATRQSPIEYLSTRTPLDLAALTYLVVICTVFAFFAQMWALQRVSASRVSLVLGTEPVYAAIIGIVFAGDRLTPLGWLGLALILVSVLAAQLIPRRNSVS